MFWHHVSVCWTRKAALGKAPVEPCNRRGFAAAKRVQQKEISLRTLSFCVCVRRTQPRFAPTAQTSFDRQVNIVLPRTQNEVALRANDVCFSQRCYGCAVNDVAASRQAPSADRFPSVCHPERSEGSSQCEAAGSAVFPRVRFITVSAKILRRFAPQNDSVGSRPCGVFKLTDCNFCAFYGKMKKTDRPTGNMKVIL